MEEQTLLQRAFNVYRDGGEGSFWPRFEQLSEPDQAEVKAQIEELRKSVVDFFEIWSAQILEQFKAQAEVLGPFFPEGDADEEEL